MRSNCCVVTSKRNRVVVSTAIVLAIVCAFSSVFAQETAFNADTIPAGKKSQCRITLRNAAIPALLIAYGVAGTMNDDLKLLNTEIREETLEGIDDKFTIDDFLQYAPAVAVYVAGAAGLQGLNTMKDEVKINAISLLIMGVTVTTMKYSFHEERPDGSSDNSFPSGHTAMAFANAEFLFQEYRYQNKWLALSGYLAAGFVGAFRVINDRHWVTDVAAGAGIGILSTKSAYCIYNHLSKRREKSTSSNSFLYPVVNPTCRGAVWRLNF
ncbi:MAG TPA: phosphatase PAP2 family protein [Bacteroidia bacterium]|nr:phosphatase PAP2 family protein [Bacteroidia bacterium]